MGFCWSESDLVITAFPSSSIKLGSWVLLGLTTCSDMADSSEFSLLEKLMRELGLLRFFFELLDELLFFGVV